MMFDYTHDPKGIIVAQGKRDLRYRYMSDQTYYSFRSQVSSSNEKVSLFDCLDAFRTQEQLEGDNQAYCSKCKEHRNCKKKMDIWKTNDILVIHLKRFGNASGSMRDKINTLVEFPINDLDLSPYVLHADDAHPPVYDLYAISYHMGSLGGGHYTAAAKLATSGEWYDFNDSSTSKTSENSLVSNSAYVLYYVRKNAETATSPAPAAMEEHPDDVPAPAVDEAESAVPVKMEEDCR